MDASNVFSRIKAISGDFVIQQQKFGRSGELCVWVEVKKLQRFGRLLAGDHLLRLDLFEFLTGAQIDNAYLLTYFLKSSSFKHQVFLRLSLDSAKDGVSEGPSCPSVRNIWGSAAFFEDELARLFGIEFFAKEPGESSVKPEQKQQLFFLNEIKGYPLRKEFVFPRDFIADEENRGSS